MPNKKLEKPLPPGVASPAAWRAALAERLAMPPHCAVVDTVRR